MIQQIRHNNIQLLLRFDPTDHLEEVSLALDLGWEGVGDVGGEMGVLRANAAFVEGHACQAGVAWAGVVAVAGEAFWLVGG